MTRFSTVSAIELNIGQLKRSAYQAIIEHIAKNYLIFDRSDHLASDSLRPQNVPLLRMSSRSK